MSDHIWEIRLPLISCQVTSRLYKFLEIFQMTWSVPDKSVYISSLEKLKSKWHSPCNLKTFPSLIVIHIQLYNRIQQEIRRRRKKEIWASVYRNGIKINVWKQNKKIGWIYVIEI